jgi:hypothetical protein
MNKIILIKNFERKLNSHKDLVIYGEFSNQEERKINFENVLEN